MSGLENARGNAATARRTTAASGARPRVSSTRVEVVDHLDSNSDVSPQDSASNAPHGRTISVPRGANGLFKDIRERRTERTRVTTKDSTSIRTRSPIKAVARTGPVESSQIIADLQRTKPLRNVNKVTSRQKEKNVLSPWDPQAKLLSHTTAPLSTRVSQPPLSDVVPDLLQSAPLRDLSLDLQESAIIEDMLFAFMGYEGHYIRFVEGFDPSIEKDRLVGPGFRIMAGLDPSLRDLASPMLKMATHYCAVEAFTEVESREEFGLINHALGASIRNMLKEYLVSIAQLEHQFLTKKSFTLHVLHLQILPTMHKISHLYALAQEMLQKHSMLGEEKEDLYDDLDVDDILEALRDGGDLAPGSMTKKICIGAHALRVLTERLSMMSGDPAARDLLQGLLRSSSQPYMTMLNSWLHRGVIRDPHSEFLIKEQKSINRDHLEEDFTDSYWDKRYTIRDNRTELCSPLEAVKTKVLLAGKYLNVVRECGGVDVSTEVQDDAPRSFDDPNFLQNVNIAYAHANSSLLNLLLTTYDLPARLRSMKRYFFLDQADFFSYFLYLGDSELKKNARFVNVGKLQSLFDLVLSTAVEPYKEDVKVNMNEQYLTKFLMSVVNVKGMEKGEEIEEMKERLPAPSTVPTEEDNKMTGFEALEFKYSVPFPVSLVISSKTVVRYQMLFRYLLSLRHLEGLVISSWEEQNKVMSWTQRSSDRKLEIWKRKAWILRGRMLNYAQQSMYYCTSEVIDPNWHKFMAKVEDNNTATTIDNLMNNHVDFLDTCLKECMLTNARLLRIHSKLVTCCTMYASWVISCSRKLFSADASLAGNPNSLEYLAAQYPPPSRPHGGIPERLRSYDPEALGVMNEMLAKYEGNFHRHLTLLLEALDYFAATETPALGRLCACLSMASEKLPGERSSEGT